MTVDGFANPHDVLKCFLAREYAFSYYLRGKEIRIGHHKGCWFCVKLQDGVVQDSFRWYDAFSERQSDNEMTKSLLDFIASGNTDTEITRDSEAGIILKALDIWAGPSNEVTKISVVQPERNATVDEKTGEFSLSRR